MPGVGLEPTIPCEKQILSLSRIPIPPPGQIHINILTFLELSHFWNLPFRVSRSLAYLNYLYEILKDKFRGMIKSEEVLILTKF